ncbi:MAG: DUF1080 domain-containing protein [Planctomycetaceae bacterium]|nr:DUF1080 domain-containing protein [Planctomycetaceae bacterium]
MSFQEQRLQVVRLVQASILLLVTLSDATISAARLADDPQDPNQAYLDAADAGAEFAVQGEYSGEVEAGGVKIKLGVQVIAEGNGKLAWVAYTGGLPGDGWDGMAPKRGSGEMQGAIGVLQGENGTAEIRDGRLAIITSENVRFGELARTTRVSPTLGSRAPSDAIVLFDGSTADRFENGKMDDNKWLIQGVTSKDKFQSFELHLEFMLSYMPNARGQGRSNSGCYMQGRYETQILDSFGLTGEQNECGGVYSIAKPKLNMCFPPLTWQTYDVEFHAAKFDTTGKKTADAWMTVKLNGVVIHEKLPLTHATTAAPLEEGPEPGPIYLQDHGNPVRFRNIWVKPLAE